MEKRIVEVPGASGSALPLSPAVAYGSLLFVSGHVGKDDAGELVEGDIRAQVQQTMRNLQRTLEHAGTSLESVLKVTVYLSDFDDFGEFNQVYKDYFEVDYPARTTIQAGRLGPGMLVEIEAIAYLPDEQ